MIGVASTAPGYSLAATLGFIVAVAARLPRADPLILSFIPMFLVAGGYNYMNRADPDCGHELRLGDPGDGAAARMADRLGDRRRRRRS